jgi:hypothetical protein
LAGLTPPRAPIKAYEHRSPTPNWRLAGRSSAHSPSVVFEVFANCGKVPLLRTGGVVCLDDKGGGRNVVPRVELEHQATTDRAHAACVSACNCNSTTLGAKTVWTSLAASTPNSRDLDRV